MKCSNYLITIPAYDGCGLEVIWENDAEMQVKVQHNNVLIAGNVGAIISLAKQLLYFACNNQVGNNYVRYDSFFCNGRLDGYDLAVLFTPTEKPYGNCFDTDSITLELNIDSCSAVEHSITGLEIQKDEKLVGIYGDEKAFLQLSKELIFLATFSNTNKLIIGGSNDNHLILRKI